MTASPTDYHIALAPCDTQWLLAEWRDLEARADTTFLTSACWVETWLESLRPDVQVVIIRYQQHIVGLGLLCWRQERRHRVLTSTVLRLARTGDRLDDQIWIEYNGLLVDRQHQHTAPSAFAAWLLEQQDWDEFELGATDSQQMPLYNPPGCTAVERWSAPAYGVDLAALRQQPISYLDSLSRNTRYQINRSRKRYEAGGQLTFNVLSSADAMLALWPELGQLHLARWGRDEQGSGFANPRFVHFHETLIRRGAAQGQVEFCILTLDDRLIGVLYNFIYRNRVYFYLSGLNEEADNQLKPGLLLHSLAIQHYLERGLDYYDFMGGESRYKQSLGSRHGDLQLVSFQRPRLALKLEQLGRRLKHGIRQER